MKIKKKSLGFKIFIAFNVVMIVLIVLFLLWFFSRGAIYFLSGLNGGEALALSFIIWVIYKALTRSHYG